MNEINERYKIKWFCWWWKRKKVVFIYLPLMIIMLLHLSALKVRPAHFRALVQRESKVLAPQIVEDIMFRSSMKALTGGKEIIFRWNCGVVATEEYSRVIFIPNEKRIINRVQLAVLHYCLCQMLNLSSEKDLVNILE